MKKLLSIAVLVLICSAGYAQGLEDNSTDTTFGGFSGGVTLNVGGNTYHDGWGDLHFASAVAAGVSGRKMFDVVPGLFLQGELKFALRTCGTGYTGRMSNAYLLVPAHLGYTFPLGDNVAIYGDAGPFVGMKLFNTRYEYDYPKSKLNRLDAGVGANVGVEINKLYRLGLGFDLGVIPVYKQEKARNGSIWLSFTYVFM